MAWTGNFKDQLVNLNGNRGLEDTTAIQQWLLDGCYDVMEKAVAKYGTEEVWKFVKKSSDIGFL